MHKSKRIVDLPKIADFLDVCEACVMGKQHQEPFPKEAIMAKTPLELNHMDLYGKMEMETLGGSYNFMMLVDNYSRRIWIYFLKTKNQALGKFKEWHVMVERESRKKLKMLRSDRGGEFT